MMICFKKKNGRLPSKGFAVVTVPFWKQDPDHEPIYQAKSLSRLVSLILLLKALKIGRNG